MPEFGWTTGEEGKTPLLDFKAGAALELSKDRRFADYVEQQKIANQLNVPTAVVEAQPDLAKNKLERMEIEKSPALQNSAENWQNLTKKAGSPDGTLDARSG